LVSVIQLHYRDFWQIFSVLFGIWSYKVYDCCLRWS